MKNLDKRKSLPNPRRIPNRVFAFKQEVQLMNYLVTPTKIHHGLIAVQARKLA